MMIEYTLYIYTDIKRNNIISLFNIESKKKRVKVVHVLNKLNSAYSKIHTNNILAHSKYLISVSANMFWSKYSIN